MSFLAGRLAGKEAAYFLQESKNAVSRLNQKNPGKKVPSSQTSHASAEPEPQPDVLPEILRHSLPKKILSQTISESTLSKGPKWALPTDPNSAKFVSPYVLNPGSALISLPQATFGPRRWNMPEMEQTFTASTANAQRQVKQTHVNPEKLKAVTEAVTQVGKAFAIATTIVFGGATLLVGMAVKKLEIHNIEDVRTKVGERVRPKFDTFRERLTPLRAWAENTSKKWHREGQEKLKDNSLVMQLSKMWGLKPKPPS